MDQPFILPAKGERIEAGIYENDELIIEFTYTPITLGGSGAFQIELGKAKKPRSLEKAFAKMLSRHVISSTMQNADGTPFDCSSIEAWLTVPLELVNDFADIVSANKRSNREDEDDEEDEETEKNSSP